MTPRTPVSPQMSLPRPGSTPPACLLAPLGAPPASRPPASPQPFWPAPNPPGCPLAGRSWAPHRIQKGASGLPSGFWSPIGTPTSPGWRYPGRGGAWGLAGRAGGQPGALWAGQEVVWHPRPGLDVFWRPGIRPRAIWSTLGPGRGNIPKDREYVTNNLRNGGQMSCIPTLTYSYPTLKRVNPSNLFQSQ